MSKGTVAVLINAGMRGSRSDGFSQGGRSGMSPLESLLQQAWLESQVPKLQKRSDCSPEIDVSIEKRASSQSSSALLSGTVSAPAGDQKASEEAYFHKTRPDSYPEFSRSIAFPELKSYSTKTYTPKTYTPKSEPSCIVLERSSKPGTSDGCSKEPPSPFTPSIFLNEPEPYTVEHILGGIEFEDSEGGLDDLAGQSEPLARFLDDILENESLEEKKCMVQESEAYQAMAKEIADLLAPGCTVNDADGSGDVECDSRWTSTVLASVEAETYLVENSTDQAMAREIADLLSPQSTVVDTGDSEECTNVEHVPITEEHATMKMMELYSTVLSKHIRDVSINTDNVDARTWVTENDEITFQFNPEMQEVMDAIENSYQPNSIIDSNLFLRTLSQDKTVPSSDCTNLTGLLYRCALAVSQGNIRSATELLSDLRQHSSPHGTAMERMAYYYMEALVAKMSGTGEQLYTVIANNHPSAARMLQALRYYVDFCPYVKVPHFFFMKTVVDAFEGATRVHLVHYGIHYGAEWPSLIQHLSQRPEGPPHLRITGIDFPAPGDEPASKVQDTGRRLEDFARRWGVPFEYNGLVGKWEAITPRDLNLRDDEVLAVCSYKLHILLDESVMATSPRELLLKRIRSLKPKVFVVLVDNAGFNAPFFMTRFRESVKHFSVMFDSMDVSMPPDDLDRVILERELLGRDILNIVACEGRARVQRAEPYRQWQNRFQRAGFTQVPLKRVTACKIKSMMASFHKDYGVAKDGGWVLMGLRNHIVKTVSAWEPTPASTYS